MSENKQNLIEKERETAPKIVYTVTEEWLNRITHIVGGLLAIAFAVLTIRKLNSSPVTIGQKAICILFSVVMVLFFLFSVLHHFQSIGKTRLRLKKISRCASSAFAVCSFLPLMTFTVFPQSTAWGIALASAVTVLAIAGVTINAVNLNKYKMACLVTYILMALCFVLRVDLLVLNKYAFVFYLVGTLVYAVGVVFYRLTKMKGHHAVWHLLALIASSLHSIAIYFYLIP